VVWVNIFHVLRRLFLSSSLAFRTTIFSKVNGFEKCFIFSVSVTKHYKNAVFTWAISVCPPAWDSVRPTKRIDIEPSKCVNTLEFRLKPGKNNTHFTWRHVFLEDKWYTHQTANSLLPQTLSFFEMWNDTEPSTCVNTLEFRSKPGKNNTHFTWRHVFLEDKWYTHQTANSLLPQTLSFPRCETILSHLHVWTH